MQETLAPKKKTRKTIEYDEAPSGAVIFYNYKEPLMKFSGGFGFQGALIADKTSGQIQCNLCGWWGEQLGHHLHKEHNCLAAEYKKKVGLNPTTALISEQFRARLIAKGIEARLKNLKSRKGRTHTPAVRARISATLRENRMEKQNQTNTCPEQILQRLADLYNKLGRSPTSDEITFEEAMLRVYGNRKTAFRLAGIPYRESGQTVKNSYKKPLHEEKVFSFIREFHEMHGRLPDKWGGEIPKEVRYSINKYGLNLRKISASVLSRDGVFKKVDYIVHYDKETLLDFLRIFHKTNGRLPSTSDCKRKLLPNASKYSYHFGSWHKALKLAFPTT